MPRRIGGRRAGAHVACSGEGPATLARRAFAAAFALMAGAFLVEAIGGFGFDHQGRNGLAVAHDLGLGLTALSMLAAAVLFGVAVGGLVASRSSARVLPMLVGLVVGAGALLGVKMMVGM